MSNTRSSNGVRSPRRERQQVTTRIQNVKSKLQSAKETGKKRQVEKLREKVKTLKEKRQELTKQIQTNKTTRSGTNKTTTSPTSVIAPTVRGGGNQARSTLASVQRRVTSINNFRISNSNPLG